MLKIAVNDDNKAVVSAKLLVIHEWQTDSSQGSHWISHKHQGLQRIIDCYSAYINHSLPYSAVTSTDRVRLKGYLVKWQQGKILIGCAMYVDALGAPSILSKVLQEEKLGIVLGLRSISEYSDRP